MRFVAGWLKPAAFVAAKYPGPRYGNGYTLVELLVALLVFALGALAVATMQYGAVQATRAASESAAALMLVEDLAQRLLSDTHTIDAYTQALDGAGAITVEGVAACLDGAKCDPQAWAQRGIAAWRLLSEQRGLALPRACVSRDAAALRLGLSWVSHSALAPLSPAVCMSGGAAESRRAVTLTVAPSSAP